MLKIVITGGIGSGKTAVTDYLEEKGYSILDADVMAHKLTAPEGRSIPLIIENFGMDYINPDGSMNRAAMRELVFNNPDALSRLEECTTMVVEQDIKRLLQERETCGDKAVFLVIPLLFESGEADKYDSIWVVIADEQSRIRRIMTRPGLTEDMARKIIAKQVSDEERMARASEIIDNNIGLDELHDKVDSLLEKYNLRDNL